MAPVDLPAIAVPLIDREAELAAARAALLSDDIRLLTLTGAPGVGKTRLAMAAAAEVAGAYADGAVFVDLTPITDHAQVSRAVAGRLGLRPHTAQPALDLLTQVLREQHLLLVLDGFEHVVDAAPDVAVMVAAAPGLKVLVTSREPLRISWEHQLVVPPLGVPDLSRPLDTAVVAASPAVMLFVVRAQAVDRAFTLNPANARAVAEICVGLDGLPLALELAAAQVKTLSPEAIRDRLDHRLTLLHRAVRDLPARHHTLRAAVGWSYSRLDPGQQALFRRLAVFVGGVPLEGAEAVCGDLQVDVLDGLASLVDRSLLQREEHPEGAPRFRMLETLREFALEQLAVSGELDTVWRRHAEFYLSLVERAAPELTGREQGQWLDRMEREYPNIRAALNRAREAGDAALLPRFVAALWRFWNVRGYWVEGRTWTAAALPLVPTDSGALRLRVLHGSSVLAWRAREYAAAAALAEETAALARRLGDGQTLAHALRILSLIDRDRRELRRAQELAAQSLRLFEDLQDRQGLATAARLLGLVYIETGEFRGARDLFERSLTLSRELGDDRGATWSTYGVAAVALAEGNLVQAAALGEACLRAFEARAERDGVAQALVHLGRVALARGSHGEAERLQSEALHIRRFLGDPVLIASSQRELAVIAQDAGADGRALGLYRESLEAFERAGDRLGIARCLEGLAVLAADNAQAHQAARLFGAADALLDRIGVVRRPGWFPAQVRPERVTRAHSAVQRELGAEAFSRAAAAGAGLSVSVAVAEAMGVAVRQPAPGGPPRIGSLTRRELEVAGLVALGLSNREIAGRLFISEHTAATHVQHILDKLDLSSRAQIAAWAVEQGIKPPA
ncbi:MAG: tetratricopeptide repeat protein [Armatimonadota bacterium]|nr:tetratricopeptide repeat protein [Armatimonadota bacterium]MDR7450722.1 tetratricopeptide repeat protein [Armatimonadota bacterium]MDR7466078.1 tetratricopeptide repeat protein [Armatimonadota bacterium]MDR7493885.1 tetratricopeptide repeat protein [Armatimonadota bacterium]MDR7498954.1 tetratricopeptide repeat protein [Armatimonadota bacterium]